ncbi:MAG: isoprenyl transferase [Devosiaceae bacterium]|nr:isoprenyl transferase [Devosiaceae bacterium MH13]
MTSSSALSAHLARDGEPHPDVAATGLPGGSVIPEHIGIIMDGNGRWAQARGLPRTEGHRKGVEMLRKAVRAVGERGVRHLTLFAFSSENWRRPPQEVRDLMGLLRLFVERDLAELKANGVRVRVLGQRDNLQPDILALLERAEHVTRHQSAQNLNIAFNYGGRDEIVRAARSLAEQVASGVLRPDQIDEAVFEQMLDTAGHPDPDLIIRTSGEMRLSNFLLWQAAYAELVFLPCMWPEFDGAALDTALAQFAGRKRRFGAVEPVAAAPVPVQKIATG